VPTLIQIADWYWGLDFHPEVRALSWFWIAGWSFPTAIYPLYYSVTLPLPMLMTSGRPISFGGVLYNVCDESTVEQWPCFPSQTKTWLANMSQPGGWKYLSQLDPKFLSYLIFMAFNLGILTAMVYYLCKPPFEESSKQETCSLCGQRQVEPRSSEIGDCEKQ
jgi:hypothetical protein